jgi:hypothetical protein
MLNMPEMASDICSATMLNIHHGRLIPSLFWSTHLKKITIIQHEYHVAKVIAKLKQDKKHNPNLVNRLGEQNYSSTGEQMQTHIAKCPNTKTNI